MQWKERDDQEEDMVLLGLIFSAIIASYKQKLYVTAFRSDLLMFRTNTSEESRP